MEYTSHRNNISVPKGQFDGHKKSPVAGPGEAFAIFKVKQRSVGVTHQINTTAFHEGPFFHIKGCARMGADIAVGENLIPPALNEHIIEIVV